MKNLLLFVILLFVYSVFSQTPPGEYESICTPVKTGKIVVLSTIDTPTFNRTWRNKQSSDSTVMWSFNALIYTDSIVIPSNGVYWLIPYNPNIDPIKLTAGTGDLTCICNNSEKKCEGIPKQNSTMCVPCMRCATPCNTLSCNGSIDMGGGGLPFGIIHKSTIIKVDNIIYQ
jgi:hypothetical protein